MIVIYIIISDLTKPFDKYEKIFQSIEINIYILDDYQLLERHHHLNTLLHKDLVQQD
jgi:hypothetical protein